MGLRLRPVLHPQTVATTTTTTTTAPTTPSPCSPGSPQPTPTLPHSAMGTMTAQDLKRRERHCLAQVLSQPPSTTWPLVARFSPGTNTHAPTCCGSPNSVRRPAGAAAVLSSSTSAPAAASSVYANASAAASAAAAARCLSKSPPDPPASMAAICRAHSVSCCCSGVRGAASAAEAVEGKRGAGGAGHQHGPQPRDRSCRHHQLSAVRNVEFNVRDA